MRFVGVGDEPADAGSGIVAGSGFAERHFVSAAIEAALAGAIENGGEHTFANFREDLCDIQIALHARREILNVIGGGGGVLKREGANLWEKKPRAKTPHRGSIECFFENRKPSAGR